MQPGGLINHVKPDEGPGVLEMGCVESVERNSRDIYPSRFNPPCN